MHLRCVHMSPALNRSFALRHFERDNAVELCNGIMFDGDCHICILLLSVLFAGDYERFVMAD